MKPTLTLLFIFIAIFLIGVPAEFAADGPGDFSIHQDAPDRREMARRKCREHLWSVHAGRDVPQSLVIYDEIEDFLILAERSLVYRELSIILATDLKTQIKERIPLSGSDLDLLNVQLVSYLELRQQLYQVAEAHECWLTAAEEFLARLPVTPFERYQVVMLSLSAALVLYDNYFLAVSIFEKDKRLRRLLNQRDPAYNIRSWQLSKISRAYLSPQNRDRVGAAIAFYEKHLKDYGSRIDFVEHLGYLRELIQQSVSYSRLKEGKPVAKKFEGLNRFRAFIGDLLHIARSEGVNLFSLLFGNTAGLVVTRNGKLNGRKDVAKRLRRQIKAGDILLEKTPFRLTDKLIPGYWGHAAIWIGTEQELVALGVWDSPSVKNYQDEIKQGKGVVEALRSGVQMNSLERFLNVDDLLVLRMRSESGDKLAKRLIRTLRQVGKPYDFSFNVETTNRIACAELIYQVFTEIDWPTKNAFGRTAISPDNVLDKLFTGSGLKVVAFYRNGAETKPDRVKDTWRRKRVCTTDCYSNIDR